MIDPDSIPRLTQNGTIEVAPLAYMRGRTLNDAFIILDEAQNTPPEQMKIFLPRAPTRVLRIVGDILGGVEDVHFSTLSSADVVRHRLVSDIVDAYERWDATRQPAPTRPAAGAPARAPRPRRQGS